MQEVQSKNQNSLVVQIISWLVQAPPSFSVLYAGLRRTRVLKQAGIQSVPAGRRRDQPAAIYSTARRDGRESGPSEVSVSCLYSYRLFGYFLFGSLLYVQRKADIQQDRLGKD